MSGVTGFVGKVLLEKILRCCPDIGTIFIMVRPKRNKKPMDRIRNEILSSYCFSRLKKQMPNFLEWAESKIVPIQGDLVMDGLGLSASDKQLLSEKCQIIINSAASVNFDDPIQDALRINYFGCLNVLELAKSCKNLDCFTHVSTCYVNCNRGSGRIAEEIYDLNMDVDAIVSKLMSTNPVELQ